MQDERDEHLSRPDWLPPVGHVLCRADRIGDGEAEIFEFRRDWQRYEIFVLRHGEAFVAYHNDCPHTGGPLDWMGRFLTRDKTLIRCAGHGAKFHIEDGLCIKGPCAGTSLAAVPVAVVAGDIVLADG